MKNFLNALKIAIREAFGVDWDLLDYPKSNIKMEAHSLLELKRLFASHKEPDTVEWLENNLKPGEVFFDVGANAGAYSFIADAVSGERARIYAFEPSFSNFNLLCRNIFLNKASERIIPLGIALSDRTGFSIFRYSSLEAGAALHNSANSVFSQEVLHYRLDDFIKDFALQPPDHIKIDVDGSELKVLRGAEKTFQNPRLKSALFEIDEIFPENAEIYGILKANGFSLLAKRQHGKTKIFNCIFTRAVVKPR